ncbi:hypothetical protein V6N13_129556 [Hibiscus sabdariffa]
MPSSSRMLDRHSLKLTNGGTPLKVWKRKERWKLGALTLRMKKMRNYEVELLFVASLIAKWEAYALFLMSRNRGNQFGRSERGIRSSGKITSLVEARRQEDQAQFYAFLVSSTGTSMVVSVPDSSMESVYRYCHMGTGTVREWYRSDSGIPRVTTSDRSATRPGRGDYICWYQSQVYAITGKVSEIKAPIAIYYHWKIPRRGVRGGGQAPMHLNEVEIEQDNEETLPPLPPVGGEANEGSAGPQGGSARVYAHHEGRNDTDVIAGVNVMSSFGDTVVVRKLYRRCPLMIQGYVFPVDMMELPFYGFDVILGMDWLVEPRARVDFENKNVSLKLIDDHEIVVVGENI